MQIKKIFTLGKDDRYQSGIGYYNRCEYKEALSEFTKVISNERNKGTLHYGLAEFYASQSSRNLGIIAMHEARFKDAIGYFEKSLKILPEATVLRGYLGVCYNNIGLYGEAIIEFEEMHKVGERDTQIDLRLALAYNNKGEHHKAIEKLKTAVALNPDHADLHYMLGVVSCSMHDYKAGILNFNKALELNPIYAEALCKNGLAHVALGQFEKAKGIFEKLIKIADEEIGHFCLALIYSVLGDERGAKAEMKDAVRLNPAVDGKDIESKSISKKALTEKMGEEFSKAIMISYTFASILTPLESSVKDIGLYNTLARIYKSILEQHPNYADFHHKLGQVYEHLHKYKWAIDEFLRAVEINPNYVHAHVSLAFAYKETGAIDMAINEFEHVISRHTELPIAYYQLALLYKEKDDKKKAIELANKALELEPDFKEAETLLKELHS